jgi:hypothetical protein
MARKNLTMRIAAKLLILMCISIAQSGCVPHNLQLARALTTPEFTASEYAQINVASKIAVEVYRNPFALSRSEAELRIADEMNSAHALPVQFVAESSINTPLEYHIVWNFSPPRRLVQPAASCRVHQRDDRPIELFSTIRLQVALCRESMLLSSTFGGLWSAKGTDDAAFIQLIQKATTDLFSKFSS